MNHTIWKTVSIGGSSLMEAKKALSDAGMHISSYAEDMLRKVDFQREKESVGLVRITVKELGFDSGATTEQIYAAAKEKGLELCPAETAIALRLAYGEQPKGEWLVVGMKTITGSDGLPRVFNVARHGVGLWLRSNWADPTDDWYPDDEFLFRFPQVFSSEPLSSLSSSEPLKLSNVDLPSLSNLEERKVVALERIASALEKPKPKTKRA